VNTTAAVECGDDDELIRRAVRANDPASGWPIPPPAVTAAELRARGRTDGPHTRADARPEPAAPATAVEAALVTGARRGAAIRAQAAAADLRIGSQEPDLAVLAALMADALWDTPVGPWLISDDATRATVFGAYFEDLAGRLPVDESAVVDVSADRSGFMVWFDAVNHALVRHPGHDEVLNRTCGRHADRFRLLDTISRHALTHAGFSRCWHLAGIGVHRSRRGTGVGAALLTQRLHDLDTEFGWPLWTLALSTAHRTLLERHGYQTNPATFLPDCGPPIWPMRRPAPLTTAEPADPGHTPVASNDRTQRVHDTSIGKVTLADHAHSKEAVRQVGTRAVARPPDTPTA